MDSHISAILRVISRIHYMDIIHRTIHLQILTDMKHAGNLILPLPTIPPGTIRLPPIRPVLIVVHPIHRLSIRRRQVRIK